MSTTRAEQIEALKEMGLDPDLDGFTTPKRGKAKPPAESGCVVGGKIDVDAVYAKFNARRRDGD